MDCDCQVPCKLSRTTGKKQLGDYDVKLSWLGKFLILLQKDLSTTLKNREEGLPFTVVFSCKGKIKGA